MYKKFTIKTKTQCQETSAYTSQGTSGIMRLDFYIVEINTVLPSILVNFSKRYVSDLLGFRHEITNQTKFYTLYSVIRDLSV